MPDRSLATEIQYLKGVGPRQAPNFAKVGIFTVGDLFYHLPRRYEDRRNLPRISQLPLGEFVTIKGRLLGVDQRDVRRSMVILRAVVHDGSGSIALTWFNQPWIRRKLEGYKGEVIAYGQVKQGNNGLEMQPAEWEIIEEDSDPDEFARITPVYPLTEGLPQKTVRKAIKSALEGYLDLVVDPLPEPLRKQQNLQDLDWSLQNVHYPVDLEDKDVARRRLVFEEFFYMQCGIAMKRREIAQELGISFPIAALLEGKAIEDLPAPLTEEPVVAASGRRKATTSLKASSSTLFEADKQAEMKGEPLWDQIHRLLPFELTGAQRRVIKEIWSDMERPHPMNRLVQGDVGSGKTAVAACAMLAAVRSGYQAVLMAPTEILAEQHRSNFAKLFESVGIEPVLLVGKLNAKEKRAARDKIATGIAKIVIGTHALIEEDVVFHQLGFVVVDEQHKFGVLQRLKLREKGAGVPDVLVMTATPIPRTLTMSMFGELDLSVIDELPAGRRPIKTHWKLPAERPVVYESVRKLIEDGRQAYFVCPMVSESESMVAQAAEELHARLQTSVYPDLKVGVLHGKMKPLDKEERMMQFRNRELDILVSTTVIEVGVDVPNATVMVIEDANRFGLAQLHQLRGRVGRGSLQSFCILIADDKSDDVYERLDTMRQTTDGFRIAEADLRLRGPGDFLGTRQSGNLDLRLGDLVKDVDLLEVARQAAFKVFEEDPQLSGEQWAMVRERIGERRSLDASILVS